MHEDAREPAFELTLEWDPGEKVAVLRHREVVLATQADVERWTEHLLALLRARYDEVGGRFPLLVDMAGFELRPRCVHMFAEVIASEVRAIYLCAHARFGEPSLTTQTVVISARKANLAPRIFTSKAEALADIRAQLRADP